MLALPLVEDAVLELIVFWPLGHPVGDERDRELGEVEFIPPHDPGRGGLGAEREGFVVEGQSWDRVFCFLMRRRHHPIPCCWFFTS